jgi:hypothetical protein
MGFSPLILLGRKSPQAATADRITSDWPTGRSEQALERTVAAITPSETV